MRVGCQGCEHGSTLIKGLKCVSGPWLSTRACERRSGPRQPRRKSRMPWRCVGHHLSPKRLGLAFRRTKTTVSGPESRSELRRFPCDGDGNGQRQAINNKLTHMSLDTLPREELQEWLQRKADKCVTRRLPQASTVPHCRRLSCGHQGSSESGILSCQRPPSAGRSSRSWRCVCPSAAAPSTRTRSPTSSHASGWVDHCHSSLIPTI
jgi:hypothetical protein